MPMSVFPCLRSRLALHGRLHAGISGNGQRATVLIRRPNLTLATRATGSLILVSCLSLKEFDLADDIGPPKRAQADVAHESEHPASRAENRIHAAKDGSLATSR
ncbi:hypothetical protein [Paraburkholderia kururiensis]|uniref:hypothetical protein n=1 Tax=Paraburkholderia kururiensis TaxID=984307 RepID=UPI0039A500F3